MIIIYNGGHSSREGCLTVTLLDSGEVEVHASNGRNDWSEATLDPKKVAKLLRGLATALPEQFEAALMKQKQARKRAIAKEEEPLRWRR